VTSDLRERLVQLAPRAVMDPRDLPELGEKLVRLEAKEKLDLKEIRGLALQVQQVYQDLREALDPKVRLALLELRAKLVQLARPEMQGELARLDLPEME